MRRMVSMTARVKNMTEAARSTISTIPINKIVAEYVRSCFVGSVGMFVLPSKELAADSWIIAPAIPT